MTFLIYDLAGRDFGETSASSVEPLSRGVCTQDEDERTRRYENGLLISSILLRENQRNSRLQMVRPHPPCSRPSRQVRVHPCESVVKIRNMIRIRRGNGGARFSRFSPHFSVIRGLISRRLGDFSGKISQVPAPRQCCGAESDYFARSRAEPARNLGAALRQAPGRARRSFRTGNGREDAAFRKRAKASRSPAATRINSRKLG
jgi:hypothetical protein